MEGKPGKKLKHNKNINEHEQKTKGSMAQKTKHQKIYFQGNMDEM